MTTSHTPTLSELAADFDAGNTEVFEGDPFADADPDAVNRNYQAVMERHILAVLRKGAGMTLAQVADNRGVTIAAARQAENRPLSTMKIASLIDQIRAIGYDVDEAWIVQSLAKNFPARTLAAGVEQ